MSRDLRRSVAVVLGGLIVWSGGCTEAEVAMPRCQGDQRLALVAQSVPEASYVPCVAELPAGWSASSFEVDDKGMVLELRSDRSERPMTISLTAYCRRGGATPIDPRSEGVRSYLRVEAISPRYIGRFYDVFAGGCVTSTFEFERGAHVTLVDELRHAVDLYARRQLAQEIEADLEVTLDP